MKRDRLRDRLEEVRKSKFRIGIISLILSTFIGFISLISFLNIYFEPTLLELTKILNLHNLNLSHLLETNPIVAISSLILSIICTILSLLLAWSNKSLSFESKQNQNIKLNKAPGSILLRLVNLLPKRYAKDLTQNISDMRLEYYEALSEKNIWRARFIAADYYIGLSWSVVRWISDKAKEVIGIIPKQN
jgi:hypothetical protein